MPKKTKKELFKFMFMVLVCVGMSSLSFAKDSGAGDSTGGQEGDRNSLVDDRESNGGGESDRSAMGGAESD